MVVKDDNTTTYKHIRTNTQIHDDFYYIFLMQSHSSGFKAEIIHREKNRTVLLPKALRNPMYVSTPIHMCSVQI